MTRDELLALAMFYDDEAGNGCQCTTCYDRHHNTAVALRRLADLEEAVVRLLRDLYGDDEFSRDNIAWVLENYGKEATRGRA